MSNDALAALAAQLAELAVLVAKQGERISQLERQQDQIAAQLGEDEAGPAFDLAGRPIKAG